MFTWKCQQRRLGVAPEGPNVYSWQRFPPSSAPQQRNGSFATTNTKSTFRSLELLEYAGSSESININRRAGFPPGQQLWAVDHARSSGGATDVIIDPGFEQENDLNESFGWRATNSDKAITLSLDNFGPKEGSTSLRVDFNGGTNAGADVISQLVLVNPQTHYRLSFAVRTASLVSGGLPNISVVDASDNQPFAQTGALPQTTNGWQDTTVNFTTGAATTAIRISLGRQPCPASPCPIFGKLWLDDFGLARVDRKQLDSKQQ